MSIKPTAVEWELMEAIWELGGAPSVREVLEFQYPNGEKAYTTVQTIMNNLVKKGVLSAKKIGLVNFYAPGKPCANFSGGVRWSIPHPWERSSA